MLKGKFELTISPEEYDNKSRYRRDNKTYLGHNNGDFRVVKWRVQ